MERQDIESLDVYNISMEIGDEIWDLVMEWDNFAKNAMGYQLVKASDSIAANISEGYGRYFFKENRQFCYIARGSLYETRTWLKKSGRRKLIDKSIYENMYERTSVLLKKLNSYIKYIESKIEKK